MSVRKAIQQASGREDNNADIKTWCSQQLCRFLGFENPELVDHILSIQSDRELSEYIHGFLGNDAKIGHFVTMLTKRKAALAQEKKRKAEATHPERLKAADHVLKAGFHKKKSSIEDEYQFASAQKKSGGKKKGGQRAGKLRDQGPRFDLRGDPMREGRHACSCMATVHALINNCTTCGKVICEQEGEGPCLFCSSLKEQAQEAETKNHSEATTKSPSMRPSTPAAAAAAAAAAEDTDVEALAAALDHKDRLLAYERQHAQRTHIYDDQEDFYDADTWLSPEERKCRKEKALKAKQEAAVAKRQIRVTIDLAGRAVHSAVGAEDTQLAEALRLSAQDYAPRSIGPSRIYANPFLTGAAPKFVPSNQNEASTGGNNKGQSTDKQKQKTIETSSSNQRSNTNKNHDKNDKNRNHSRSSQQSSATGAVPRITATTTTTPDQQQVHSTKQAKKARKRGARRVEVDDSFLL